MLKKELFLNVARRRQISGYKRKYIEFLKNKDNEMGKGYTFEVDEVDFWRAALSNVEEKYIYRVEGSGRNKLATKTGSASLLEGDVSLELAKAMITPKNILIECKHHKSRTIEKSLSVKKEWVDQALHEATANNSWSVVAIKFKNVRPNSIDLRKYNWADGKFGNNVHYIMPRGHFLEMIEYIDKIRSEANVDLGRISTEDLMLELRKRLK